MILGWSQAGKSKYNLTDLLSRAHRLLVNPFFSLDVDVHPLNTSRHVLTVSYGGV